MKAASLALRTIGVADPLRRALTDLEDDWSGGSPIRTLEDHWAQCGPGASETILSALIKTDMAHRFDRGEPVEAADYLERFPELGHQGGRMVSLIYEEFCLREERGERPDPEEFAARYAPWHDSILSQLRCHSLLSQVVAPTATPRFPEPGERFGGFRLGEVLGRGGAAQVYRALDDELGGREVTLKVSTDRGDEPSIQGRLDHAHIVPVLSVVRPPESNLRGLCMPYRPGLSLDRLIERVDPTRRPRRARALWDAVVPTSLADRRPTPETPGWQGFPIQGAYAEGVAWVVATLASALGHAHARGILHRDVKPANIILSVRDGPQLLDFNLAHDPHAAEQANAALRGGTLPYMAPEQLEAFLDQACWDRVGPAADLYALGLVFRELLTGLRPELHDPALPLPRAVRDLLDRRSEPPALLRLADPTVPHALDAIVARCLAPAPANRYQDAGALVDDLERFLARRPLATAVNPSRTETLANWGRRNLRRFVLTGLFATAMTLGGFVLLTKTGSDRERNRHEAMQCVTQGASLASRKRWDEARALYERALRLDPASHQSHAGLGDVAFHDKRFSDAFRHLSQAIEIAETTSSRATAAERSRYRLARAGASFQWGVQCLGKLKDGQGTARPHFIWALRDLKRARLLESNEAICYRISKNSGYIEMLLGDEESRRGKPLESIDHYTRSIRFLGEASQLNPDDQETVRYLQNAEQCLAVVRRQWEQRPPDAWASAKSAP
jgi:serine/threonine protein kinase